MKKALVIGGGLVGSLQAANLSRRGYQVEVFERRDDIRTAEISAGKSINLALSTRGWKAVEMVGVKDKVEEIAIPMYGRKIHSIDGQLSFHPYGKEDQAIYSVSRGELNACLLEQAENKYGVNLHFNWKCNGVDFDNRTAHFTHSDTGEQKSVSADLIFGTDGAFSAVRASMQKTRRFNYQQEYIPHGYRELLLPANEDGSFKLDKNALHIWPRGQYMLIALPNLDGSFTCTLFMPYEGENSFESLESDQAVETFFKEQFNDFYELMPNLVENYHAHPLSDLVIIRCFPWVKNNTTIMGDASHAIVPFYGQGMNAGFEDCTVLDELIEKYDHDWDKILPEFQVSRKPNADAIAELAVRNYVEMRDLVADPDFILRKKIENHFYDKHPDKWMPLYSQVTFSHIPYETALKQGIDHDRIMEKIMAMNNIDEKWNSEEVEKEIMNFLES